MMTIVENHFLYYPTSAEEHGSGGGVDEISNTICLQVVPLNHLSLIGTTSIFQLQLINESL